MLLAPAELRDEIANRPRVLLVHGEEDEVVPAEASRVAADVLQSLDVPVELLLRRDLGHSIDPEGIAAGARLLQDAFSGA
jgi:phospholipase/carboxylesterase